MKISTVARYNEAKKHIKQGKLLDIGSEKGDLKRFLPKEVDYHGVDITPKVKWIKKVNVTKKKLPFRTNEFDYIFMGEILEHLDNQHFVLQEARRVLKPSGIFVGSVPNCYNFYHMIRAFFRKDSNTWEHVCIYDRRAIISLLRNNGFKDVRARGLFFKRPWGETNNKFLERKLPYLCYYWFFLAKNK